jgi:hypothetical protein
MGDYSQSGTKAKGTNSPSQPSTGLVVIAGQDASIHKTKRAKTAKTHQNIGCLDPEIEQAAESEQTEYSEIDTTQIILQLQRVYRATKPSHQHGKHYLISAQNVR